MIRKARVGDVRTIQGLIEGSASKGEMLHRSLSEIYDNIRDFYIFQGNQSLVGACALHICWEDLAEVRSLTVLEEERKKGIGSELVKACLREARRLGVRKVFALTYKPSFFQQFGFGIVDKAALPHKVWSDCLKCVKFPDCDEIAMILEL
ncbi:MAG: N-acetyltransferase [Syntrophobacterales bacterium]|nr:MAG: N-acetyltransferase [Syntrophobacterales bacterium]